MLNVKMIAATPSTIPLFLYFLKSHGTRVVGFYTDGYIGLPVDAALDTTSIHMEMRPRIFISVFVCFLE